MLVSLDDHQSKTGGFGCLNTILLDILFNLSSFLICSQQYMIIAQKPQSEKKFIKQEVLP
jgi:hypothetical protein